MIKNIFTSAFLNTETESLQHIQASHKKPDHKVMLICVTVAFSLTMIKYFGDEKFMLSLLKNFGFTSLSDSFEDLVTVNGNARLYRLLYWVSVVILFYILPPLIVIKLIFKERLSEYGLKINGAFKDYKIYLLMLGVMIPLVLFFSNTESFQARYPFYEIKKGESYFTSLLIWELFYFIQFFALEFFFRGFLLHGTKKRFGFYSVFVMTIPYCMIHFGKPFPETIAAIIAGIVLGVLSLKSRSIWLGVAIHYSVAITMDLCSMWQKGVF